MRPPSRHRAGRAQGRKPRRQIEAGKKECARVSEFRARKRLRSAGRSRSRPASAEGQITGMRPARQRGRSDGAQSCLDRKAAAAMRPGRIARRFVPPSDVAGTSAMPGAKGSARRLRSMGAGPDMRNVCRHDDHARVRRQCRRRASHRCGKSEITTWVNDLRARHLRAISDACMSCVTTTQPTSSRESRTASSTSSNIRRARRARSACSQER